MATLPTKSFDEIVSNIAAGMQARVSSFLNFAIGSVFRAIAEAYAGVQLWLQSLALQIMLLGRLATSFGADVDTWLADWGLISRIGSVAATGLVVFSRFSPSSSAPVIPIGSTVKTQDGTQSFQVYADTTNPAYSAQAGGYVMPAQVTSLIVPVISITPSANGTIVNGVQQPGANGNVSAGAIALISSQINGVDAVTNPAAFTNGSDQETDAAVKIRFRLALQALSRGTAVAIVNAIMALQTGMQVQVRDGEQLDGTTAPGVVSVIVDDGSGSISSALLAACQAAANAVRAAGVRMGVYAAQPRFAGVALTLTLQQGYSRGQVAAQITAAISAGINTSGLGSGLGYFNVGAMALSVPGVAKIDGLLLNGGTADIAADPRYTIKCSGVVVS